jgi:diguanylate cyclase (GGDEF)-like protein
MGLVLLLRRKPVGEMTAETGADTGEGELSRSIGLFQLTAFGVGATIGTGIFLVLTQAVPVGGPAVILSFVFAGVEYRLIRPQDYGVNFYNDVLVTREALVKRKPREVEAFREASLRGWRYALDNIEETVDLIHAKYAPHKSREHLLFEGNKIRELTMPDLVDPGHMNPGRWETIANSYIELGMADASGTLNGFLYTEQASVDLAWFYRVAGLSIAGLLLASLIAARFARLNRRLVSEAAKRRGIASKLKEKQRQLYRLANTDQLTEVWNRLKFDQIAGHEVDRSRRYRYPLSLIFLDIDHFKEINDGHGHGTGDQVLVDIVRLIRGELRESDELFRWGGEEFLILVPHSSSEAARSLAERLRMIIGNSIVGPGLRVTASLGPPTEFEALTAQPQATRDPSVLAETARKDAALLRRGVKMRTLYQHAARRHSATRDYVVAVSQAGGEVRTLDEFFNKILIFDRRVAIIPGPDGIDTAIAVREPAIVAYLVDVYERSWERARPFSAADTSTMKEVAGEQRSMTLRMLIEGHSDPAASKRLGVSPRTYAGYVSDLKDEFGADTRFQLGYEIGRSDAETDRLGNTTAPTRD